MIDSTYGGDCKEIKTKYDDDATVHYVNVDHTPAGKVGSLGELRRSFPGQFTPDMLAQADADFKAGRGVWLGAILVRLRW